MRIERDIWQTLGAILALALVFGSALWLPLHLKQKRLRVQLADAEKRLQQERADSAGLESLQSRVEELQATLQAMPKHVPGDGETASLLRQLSSDLDDLLVARREMVTQPVVEGTQYSLIPMTLKFTGSYKALYQFLEKLESNPRLIRVIRLELDGGADRLHEPVQVRIDLMTFFSRAEWARLQEQE